MRWAVHNGGTLIGTSSCPFARSILRTEWAEPGNCQCGSVDGQSFGITVVDISGSPLSIIDQVGIAGAGFSPGTDGPANFPIESALQGDTLFVASGGGVSVFDVSNPNSVQTLAVIPLITNPINVDIVNDSLYVVANSHATLITIDISDISSPVVETTGLAEGSGPLSVAVTSSHLVIQNGLRLKVLVRAELKLCHVFRQTQQFDTFWQRLQYP